MITRLSLLALVATLLPSCAVTGDPSEGGLFGFSDSMYNQRIDEKRQVLTGIHADTSKRRAEAAALERQLNAAR